MLSRKATPANISTIPLTSAAPASAGLLLRRWNRHYLINAPKGEMRGDGEPNPQAHGPSTANGGIVAETLLASSFSPNAQNAAPRRLRRGLNRLFCLLCSLQERGLPSASPMLPFACSISLRSSFSGYLSIDGLFTAGCGDPLDPGIWGSFILIVSSVSM